MVCLILKSLKINWSPGSILYTMHLLTNLISLDFFGSDYDVNVFFIAMFAGVNKAAAGPVKKKMRKHSDPVLEPHLLFYKGEIKSFKQSLKLDRKDTPYFFVLDENGSIVHTTSGAYSQDKMDAVEELLEDW